MYFSAKFIRMRKTTYLLLLFILTFISCGKKTDFTLKGNIGGLNSDTLLVYYQLPHYKLDTIYATNGSFNYTIHPDTFTIFSLILDSLDAYPIYADKGETVEISGSIDSLIVKGKGENEKQAQIIACLKNASEGSIYNKVDSIIEANPFSFTNLYLMEKYYAQDTLPKHRKMKELIDGMGGVIKDTPYMMNLLAMVEDLNNHENNRSLYTFVNKDREGKNLNWTSIKDKYILLDFWASWDAESVEAQDSLVPVLKALKKEKFVIVSVSLDVDKEAWLQASERDTTQWKQVCDFSGWNNKLVKEQDIRTLPTNILLDKNKRIIERDICGKALIDKVKQLIKQDEEREKARKEAEKKRKKKK